jgi:hypothetical protein
MKFGDLKSGDVVNLMGVRSVILAIESPHPLNPSFLLVVWFLFGDNRLSFDMLHPDYELIPGTSVSQDGMYSYRKAMDIVHHNSGQV